MAETAGAPDPVELRAALMHLADETTEPMGDPRPAYGTQTPDDLVRGVAEWVGRPESDVRESLTRVVGIYLQSLGEPGWNEWPVVFEEIPPAARPVVRLACRLALLEGLGSSFGIPLLVGPELPALGVAQARALGRALRRVGSAVQVLHFAPAGGPWAEYATAIRSLD